VIEKEPPVVCLFTIVRYGGEYAVVEVRMQGDRVLSREVVDQNRRLEGVWQGFIETTALRFGRKEVH
jgi:hypothetical protein